MKMKNSVWLSVVSNKHLVENSSLLQLSFDEAEISSYESFSYQKKRLQWLRGRIAAKNAVKKALLKKKLPLRAISIRKSQSGKPVVVVNDKPITSKLSISHGDSLSIAAASKNDVGVDVEPIRRKSSLTEKRVTFFLQEDEIQATLQANDPALQQLTYWTLKEAAVKVLNLTVFDLKDVAVLRHNKLYYLFHGENVLYGRVFRYKDHIVALVLPTKFSFRSSSPIVS